MAEAGHCHSHTVFVTVFYGIIISDGASGLHHGVNPGVMGYLHTVGKGEEGIRSHHGAIKVEAEIPGFIDCLAQGVHTGSLPYPGGV